jgi:shikimate kinase
MRVFLGGVSCVGKTTIGACLANRLGCSFLDLDQEIEKSFGKPIEGLRTEARMPYRFRKQFAAVVLKELLHADPGGDLVILGLRRDRPDDRGGWRCDGI